jgi:hypothetical protein
MFTIIQLYSNVHFGIIKRALNGQYRHNHR